MLVLEITIDSLGAANDFAFRIVFHEVFSEKARIGIGVITSNDDETVEVKGLGVRERASELLRCFNLVTSGAYNTMCYDL